MRTFGWADDHGVVHDVVPRSSDLWGTIVYQLRCRPTQNIRYLAYTENTTTCVQCIADAVRDEKGT
jgi:hypothetical protein